jgi:hypothetical protein
VWCVWKHDCQDLDNSFRLYWHVRFRLCEAAGVADDPPLSVAYIVVVSGGGSSDSAVAAAPAAAAVAAAAAAEAGSAVLRPGASHNDVLSKEVLRRVFADTCKHKCVEMWGRAWHCDSQRGGVRASGGRTRC